MYKQSWRKPRQSTNNIVFDIFSIGLTLYIAYLNTKTYKENLYLNVCNSEKIKEIFKEIEIINNKI